MRFIIRQLYDSSIVHQSFTTEKINTSGIYNGGDYDRNHRAKKKLTLHSMKFDWLIRIPYN